MQQTLNYWCRERELNPHGILSQRILSPIQGWHDSPQEAPRKPARPSVSRGCGSLFCGLVCPDEAACVLQKGTKKAQFPRLAGGGK